MQDILSKTSNPKRQSPRPAIVRPYTRSSSFIMAALFTLLCGAAALSLGYFINYFARGHFVHSTEEVLDSEIRFLRERGVPEQTQEGSGRIFIPLTSDGQFPPGFPVKVKRFAEGIIVFTHPENGRLHAAKIHTAQDGSKLLVGFDIEEMAKDFGFMQALGIASIVFVILIVLISFFISVFVVRGTNKIAATAQEIITTGDLSRRVDVPSRWDDLSNMAATLNQLLSRIEELMDGVRHVSDNIAHDLRTPLTRLKNHIETAIRERPEEQERFTPLLQEADHLLATFNALIRIARIETERQKKGFRDFDLTTLLTDVAELYAPLAEEKNITLSPALTPAPYHGDRDLLFQAFANILDNAIKFTPDGGKITMTLENPAHPIITISDSGPGVPEEEVAKIFQRFYRTEKSRTSPGAGLGLSLVAAVIALHGGRVEARNTHPGFSIITFL